MADTAGATLGQRLLGTLLASRAPKPDEVPATAAPQQRKPARVNPLAGAVKAMSLQEVESRMHQPGDPSPAAAPAPSAWPQQQQQQDTASVPSSAPQQWAPNPAAWPAPDRAAPGPGAAQWGDPAASQAPGPWPVASRPAAAAATAAAATASAPWPSALSPQAPAASEPPAPAATLPSVPGVGAEPRPAPWAASGCSQGPSLAEIQAEEEAEAMRRAMERASVGYEAKEDARKGWAGGAQPAPVGGAWGVGAAAKSLKEIQAEEEAMRQAQTAAQAAQVNA